MTINRHNIICIIFLTISTFSFGQNPQIEEKGLRIMFYNVENLFHPEDDSLKKDEEFTPEGLRHWSFYRYHQKLNRIAQNIIAIGEWEPPAIVGLCEIENKRCLEDLIYLTPLKTFGYEIIHQESPDQRGIDVALLYRPDFFEPLATKFIPIVFPEDRHPTRDILYVEGMANKDTLHCFVNHWPSRYGGQLESAPKRNHAAQILKMCFDSIQSSNPAAAIIALGDFNDSPSDHSMADILMALADTTSITNDHLINLTGQFEGKTGTNKYQHQWHVLDQCIVNQNLLDSTQALYTSFSQIHIFKPKWLLTDESDGFGQKPFRTYSGFKYIDGYSDHLPIYVDLFFR